jgi:hypothetical protein
MKHQKSLVRLSVICSGFIFAVVPIMLAFSGGPLPRKTGSTRFGENSCTQCHGGTANSGTGKLDLTGVPETYVPGQTYNVKVTLQQTGQSRWGFELATRKDDGTQTGTLQIGPDGFTQIITDGGVQFIEHTSVGTRAGTANGPVDFNFTWKAPDTNVGEVFFSVAGNAANNNGTNTGDFIYTKEESINGPGSGGGGGGQNEPRITTFTPNSGPVTGGTPFVIWGKDFSAGATVTIGGAAATNIVVSGDSYIYGVTPAAANVGPVDVVCSSGGKSATLPGGFTYLQGSTANPSAKALIVPYVIDTDNFRTNLGMSNLTSSSVNVTVHLADLSGIILATKAYTVPGGGLNQVSNIVRTLLDDSIVSNKEGYLILEPSVDDSITAFATPIDNSTQDSSVIQSGRSQSTHLLLPTSTSTGLFKTTLTLINESEVNNQVEIKMRNTNGEVQTTKTVTLAPYGSFSSEDIHAFLGITGTFGPIELRSIEQTPKPIVAISKVYAELTTDSGKKGTASSFFVAEPMNP